jgi:PIN domain nuclease of toxin-antitoxin system
MKLLIDTHTFLWFIQDNPNLSDYAASLLESDADLLLSIASLWEIAIKVNLQKLTLPDAYETFIPH